ncbi:hypothetical protein CGCF415_v002166 [Colletotrichum fructicola]|nr:hypothetical protein CGCF415_v002166 [Colletotrichum fructicola]KAF4923855.1 hypothetical protein CGCF245_v014799 [Colletotrichum fructicola]KAF5509134.1 hypothetical protein CGCF413_v003802 [Colletotrichum fructicola]
MHISRLSFAAILAWGSAVTAAPASHCNIVDTVYAILRGPLRAEASQFCLGYLGGMKTTTVTTTATQSGPGRTVTVTVPDQTQAQTVTLTNVNQQTMTNTITGEGSTATVTVTVTAGTKTIYQKKKRNNRPACPPALRLFAESRISSACSCIAQPTTKTITATAKVTVSGPQATQTAPGKTVIVTVTQTVQVTSQTQVTKTVAGDAVTQTVTTAVTPILVKPKICNARGLPGPNAFNYDANFNTNQADCIASCKIDNRCLSTGFYIVTDPGSGTQTGTCRKYDKSVTDSADLGPGYYNFNDKAC